LSRGRLAIGIIILAFGVITLLNGLNFTNVGFWDLLGKYWPLLLIAWGAGFLAERTGTGGKVLGSFVFLLGLGFLGNNLSWFSVNIGGLIWPTILILIGISFLFGFHNGGRSNVAIMSGVERKDTWDLKNGSYLAFMGGIDLDLRQAQIPEGTIHMNVTAFMGGVNIIVPPELAVDCEGTAVLGGVEFFKKNSGGIIASLHESQGDVKGAKVVRISCFAAMGGITVKSAAMGERVDW
jgi:predicted membrane protein